MTDRSLPPVVQVYDIGPEMLESLYRIIASVARWGNHGWEPAMKLTLRELFARFDALKSVISDEKASMPSGPPGTKM